jgi:hypothetical protein
LCSNINHTSIPIINYTTFEKITTYIRCNYVRIYFIFYSFLQEKKKFGEILGLNSWIKPPSSQPTSFLVLNLAILVGKKNANSRKNLNNKKNLSKDWDQKFQKKKMLLLMNIKF